MTTAAATGATGGQVVLAAVLTGLVTGLVAFGGVVLAQRGESRRASEARRHERQNTISTLRASLYEVESARLREALAEYCHVTYYVDSAWRNWRVNGGPWPGEHWENVKREDVLVTQIRLLIDDTKPEHRQLTEALESLREYDSEEPWLHRRDSVIRAATEALRGDAERAVGSPESS